MKPRFVHIFSLITSILGALGCSAAGTGIGSSNEPGSGGSGSNLGGSQPNLQPSSGSGGGLVVSVGGGSGVKDPNDPREVPVRQKTCDDSGENCTCLRLALLGTLASAATDPDTKQFVNWLNGNSDGSATATMISTKPTLDAAFLAGYDVLVVANVNGWTFSAEEKTAVETWVKEQGGGIITLTGFVSTPQEVTDTSQLIEFSGVRYGSARTAEGGAAKPVYYQGGSLDLKPCLGWTGSYVPKDTTPIQFMPQTGSLEKLTSSLSYVGAFIGFGVDAPADATVVATDPMSGLNMAVAKEVDGKGRVLAFGDEWVILTSLWEPLGSPSNMQMDAGNMCWHPADASSATGFFHSVKTLYQTKQFWYDAINWVAPPSECNFTVTDPDVVVK